MHTCVYKFNKNKVPNGLVLYKQINLYQAIKINKTFNIVIAKQNLNI